jgi:uncharacterized iron-regulated membrane protein
MSVTAPGTRWYNAVWRWHFYAALLCVPFVLWLSITGTLYLWKPQIEALIERPYEQLPVRYPRATAEAQVAAALKAVPGATLHKYQWPENEHQAARIIVGAGGAETRVYVDPWSARVVGKVREEDRLMNVIMHLHGELKAGKYGSWLVEIAACWAVVMLLTGLYLWWPRGRRGLGGVLYPRLRSGKRLFWRDIHAVAGIWVSTLALFLIATGLPWANFWGDYFKEVRAVTRTADGPQDWPTGNPATAAMLGEHAEHKGMTMSHKPAPGGELDRVIAAIAPLGVAAPVMIAPPTARGEAWTVTSDSANRPERTRITVDGATGRLLSPPRLRPAPLGGSRGRLRHRHP